MNNAQKIAAKSQEVHGDIVLGSTSASVEVAGKPVLTLPVSRTERMELSRWMDANDGFSAE